MGPVLFPLSIALLIGGATSVYLGVPIISAERGWAMVIAGSVAASGGSVLLGLAVCNERLKRVERAIVSATASRPASPEPPDEPARRLPPVREPIAAVVGSYSAGVNSYDMFADGSIKAVTPDGEHHFASMEEFRAFAGSGAGKKTAPAEKPEAGPAESGSKQS